MYTRTIVVFRTASSSTCHRAALYSIFRSFIENRLHQAGHFLVLGVEDAEIGKPAASGRVNVAVEYDGQDALLLGRGPIDVLAQRNDSGSAAGLGRASISSKQNAIEPRTRSVRLPCGMPVMVQLPSSCPPAPGGTSRFRQTNRCDQHSQDHERDDAIKALEFHQVGAEDLAATTANRASPT